MTENWKNAFSFKSHVQLCYLCHIQLAVFNVKFSSICRTLESVPFIPLKSQKHWVEYRDSCSMNDKLSVETLTLFWGTCLNDTHFWPILVTEKKNEIPSWCLTLIFLSFIMWGKDEVKAISWSKHWSFDDLMMVLHILENRQKQYLHTPCWSEIPLPVWFILSSQLVTVVNCNWLVWVLILL